MPVSDNATGTINPLAGITAEATFTPATASADGVRGQCPAPPAGTPSTYVLSAGGTWVPGGGGGGGGITTLTAVWATTGTANKDQQSAPSTPINSGINLTFTANTGSAAPTVTSITVGGVALTGTFTPTGTFPTYTLNIAYSGAVIPASVELNGGSVVVLGSFNGNNYAVTSSVPLTTNPPVAFTTTLTTAYLQTSIAYYTTTAQINYSYSNSVNILSFGGVITPTGGTAQNCTSSSGSFTNQPVNGFALSGSATGMGQYGAGNSSVNFSGSIPAVSQYIPAFYGQTANSTPPSFTTASSQTAGAANGSTITYTAATATTQYDWIATQRPLANIKVQTSLGLTTFVPDVTASTQTISGQTFNVYGITNLIVGQSLVLVIS